MCRDAAARWALATADTATLRRRLLVPALRESRGIADHPLWAHTSEPLRPDLEELNERVEHALELGYSLTGALRRSVAYRFRDYTFARLFQPPAIDAERAEAIVRRDARPPPVFIPAPRRLPQGGADTPPPLSMDDILYLGSLSAGPPPSTAFSPARPGGGGAYRGGPEPGQGPATGGCSGPIAET